MTSRALLLADAVDGTTRAAVDEALVELVAAPTVRAVVEALVRFVRAVGADVVPAREEDGEVLPLDLSFGEVAPILPSAPPTSVARFRLEVVLPALATEASGVVRALRARDAPVGHDLGPRP